MSEPERAKTRRFEPKHLWEDPEFPAVQNSVFYYQVPQFTFEWKRATTLYQNPKFIVEDCNKLDVVSGRLGEKWLQSCMGLLYKCKSLFRVIVPKQSIDFSTGMFRFRLWWCGEWTEVTVDDRLPTVNGQLVFMHTTHTEQLWPALLEKAYAKLYGSYEALKYVNLLDGLVELTGGIAESLSLQDIDDAELIQSYINSNSIVSVRRITKNITQNLATIEAHMNYRVLAVERLNVEDGPVYMVQLSDLPTSIYSNFTLLIFNHERWASIGRHEKERLPMLADTFWMLYSDFKETFQEMDILTLDGNLSIADPSLSIQHKWHVKSFNDRWRKGITAGGCPNHDSFYTNPQIQMLIDEPSLIVISLSQHTILDPKIIGFNVFRLPNRINETMPHSFFKSRKVFLSSSYTNSRQISGRSTFGAGAYLIIPTTYHAQQEANFTLRIYSTKQAQMTALDSLPQQLRPAIVKAPATLEANSFAQYESQFKEKADEHKTVNAFELQELLEKCLPNDYIKSCATIETCREVVLSMDEDDIGRITLSDFRDFIYSLKHWQIVFRDHTPDKMSVLRAEKLREALRDVGFVLPQRALSTLLVKYMRKDGMLRFGDFVSAVMLLHRAFQIEDGPHILMSKN